MRALSALALLSLAASAASNPTVVDQSTTNMNVHKLASTDPSVAHLAVTVERVDRLVEDEDGSILAAKIVDITLFFDVNEDSILINGVPVEAGISKVLVESATLAQGPAKLMPAEMLDAAFDAGIAALEVHVVAENKALTVNELAAIPLTTKSDSKDGEEEGIAALVESDEVYEVRRFTIAARVLELNGVKVKETTFIRQTLDIIHDGTILRSPCSSSEDALIAIPADQSQDNGLGEYVTTLDATIESPEMDAEEYIHSAGSSSYSPCHGKLAAAWDKVPKAARIAISAFTGSILLLLFFIALPLGLYLQYREKRYARLALQDEEENAHYDSNPFQEPYVAADEKAHFVEPSPAYSTQE
ncbi:hypothetical protein BJ684DRAFT_14367 [Piptocephalis cylindrospora]|uniref:Uncharacterized protein n=1 Tax=Piptocephalis cylindrospora TaxID=1907219 RepID=A0A4P9Y8A3_9FUNG|nr:hypothetical protein BJ684DRAFT_14367 [Piptocephalis cylindrospora]|eukprot:RKP15387.1 hypothetical protein BJ684DRAFT_14367 [Piptocephalis cylindrospora]